MLHRLAYCIYAAFLLTAFVTVSGTVGIGPDSNSACASQSPITGSPVLLQLGAESGRAKAAEDNLQAAVQRRDSQHLVKSGHLHAEGGAPLALVLAQTLTSRFQKARQSQHAAPSDQDSEQTIVGMIVAVVLILVVIMLCVAYYPPPKRVQHEPLQSSFSPAVGQGLAAAPQARKNLACC
ncbi:unnamed protein product [Polarella glacialis]|uniref:Uncharacterized protein n=1 Tax=Polarella glacialis TaxID=89957 RepID=A0A813IF90_POLGL|nr:unnamed protein product [Polarella glacialis]